MTVYPAMEDARRLRSSHVILQMDLPDMCYDFFRHIYATVVEKMIILMTFTENDPKTA